MSKWEKREAYLIDAAKRCLVGRKTFELCRSHLVGASQISRGTIYNHFPSEYDLIVAVSTSYYIAHLELAIKSSRERNDPTECFILHHCDRLFCSLFEKNFVVERIMPNDEILANASIRFQKEFEKVNSAYQEWNRNAIEAMGKIQGFNRNDLVRDFVRGTMINSSDERDFNDLSLYKKYGFALINLTGHSESIVSVTKSIESWYVKVISKTYK